MRKVRLHNLRVNGNRIDQGTWNRVSEILLPGPAPSPSDVKHGKSKSAVLKRIVATDKETRAKALKLAGELMSAAAKAEAASAGWLPKSLSFDDLPKLPNGDIAPCELYPNGLHADGRDYVALVAEIKKATAPSPAVMLCCHCGGPSTRVLKDIGITDKSYCDRHDARTGHAAALPHAGFTFGNTPVSKAGAK